VTLHALPSEIAQSHFVLLTACAVVLLNATIPVPALSPGGGC
jgi:hypothetical protein